MAGWRRQYQTKICIEKDSLHNTGKISTCQELALTYGTILLMQTKFPKCKNLVECFGGELVTLKNGNVDTQVLIILM